MDQGQADDGQLDLQSSTLRLAYEADVRALDAERAEMIVGGRLMEQIARALHQRRRDLAELYKARTPEPLATRIRQRTVNAYGNPLGPSIEQLRAKGRTWDEIARSACAPGSTEFLL